jgi:hypothetical protein
MPTHEKQKGRNPLRLELAASDGIQFAILPGKVHLSRRAARTVSRPGSFILLLDSA